jgi:hypothetical protein
MFLINGGSRCGLPLQPDITQDSIPEQYYHKLQNVGSEVRKGTTVYVSINPEPSIDIEAVMKMGDKFQQQQYDIETAKGEKEKSTGTGRPVTQPDSYAGYTEGPKHPKSEIPSRSPYSPPETDSPAQNWVKWATRFPSTTLSETPTASKTEPRNPKPSRDVTLKIEIEYFVPKGFCSETLKGNECIGKGWTGNYMELHEITVFDERGQEIGNYYLGKKSEKARLNPVQGVWTEDITFSVPSSDIFYVEVFAVQWNFADYYPKDWCVHHFIVHKAFTTGQS